MENKAPKKDKQTKKRSKAAKIVLFSILGCIGVDAIVILVKLIIGMAGGTGTQDGSILGLGFGTLFTILGFLALALILAWLLTEPSFKKEETVVIDNDRNSYVKKAKTPRPLADKTGVKTEENKPDEEKPEEKPEEKSEEKSEEKAAGGASEEKAEEKAAEEPAEEKAEEKTEEPVEETADEAPEEPAGEITEEATEEKTEEPVEEVAEEKTEETDDESDDEDSRASFASAAAPAEKAESRKKDEDKPVAREAESADASESDDNPAVFASAVVAGAVAGAAAVGAAETVFVRYRRSYMSRLIQSDGDVKAYYTDIKNKLLSYKGVRDRISWDFESFNAGRKKLAKINVKGKTITVNLALDPKTVEAKYYAGDTSGKPKLSDVPTLMKVKSGRSVKYTLELIEKMMEQEGIPANAVPSKKVFDLEYRDTDALVKEGYIKAMYDKEVAPDGNYIEKEVDIKDFISK